MIGLIRLTFFAASAALTLACPYAAGASYSYDAVKQDFQEVTYDRGSVSVNSRLNRSFVAIQPSQDGKRISLFIFVGNASDAPIEFSEGDVAVSAGGKMVKVVPAAELKKQAKRSAAWQSAASGLAAGVASRPATYSGSSTYRDELGNPVGRATHSGTVSDPAATQQATQIAAARDADIRQARDSRIQHIDPMSLERTTIAPGGSISGLIAIEAPKPRGKADAIDIYVEVAGEIHNFVIRETKD